MSSLQVRIQRLEVTLSILEAKVCFLLKEFIFNVNNIIYIFFHLLNIFITIILVYNSNCFIQLSSIPGLDQVAPIDTSSTVEQTTTTTSVTTTEVSGNGAGDTGLSKGTPIEVEIDNKNYHLSLIQSS